MNETLQDPRLGKPSASSMKRTRRCPGWLNLLAKLPARDTSTKDSDAGESRHSLIEIEVDASTIEDTNESYTVGMAQRLCEEAIAKTFGSLDGVEVHTEERLWMYDEGLEPMCSARLDWFGIKGDTALICDYKTLFADHGIAAENEQLATQAALLRECFPVSRVVVALIQPNLSADRRLTMASFEREDLVWAWANTRKWCVDSASPYAPRIPGPVQCEHCPCRADCPEAIAAELAITIADTSKLSEPEAIAVLLDRAELADKVVKSIREKAKRLIEAGTVIPGWHVEEGDEQRKITKPIVLAGVLAEAGATTEQINAIAKIGVSDADKLYYQLSKQADGKTQKAAKEELEQKLLAAGALEKSRKAGSLARKK
jgi:hypothetical protein